MAANNDITRDLAEVLNMLAETYVSQANAHLHLQQQRFESEQALALQRLESEREMFSRLIQMMAERNGVYLEEPRSEPGPGVGSGSGSADLPGTSDGRRMQAPKAKSGVVTLAEPGPRRQQVESERADLPGTSRGQPMSAPGAGGSDGAALPGTSHGQTLTLASGMGKEQPQLLPDIFVTVRRNGRKATGVIREVLLDGSCKLASGPGEVFTALSNEIEVIAPGILERVKILGGRYRGATGKLVKFDETCGRVLLEDFKLTTVDRGHFAKLFETSGECDGNDIC